MLEELFDCKGDLQAHLISLTAQTTKDISTRYKREAIEDLMWLLQIYNTQVLKKIIHVWLVFISKYRTTLLLIFGRVNLNIIKNILTLQD